MSSQAYKLIITLKSRQLYQFVSIKKEICFQPMALNYLRILDVNPLTKFKSQAHSKKRVEFFQETKGMS